VTDTGVGISMERQQAVFAAYEQAETSTTRRFGGSGLGLSICRELAASMGGQLHLRSAPGKGTTVWLELVLAACAAPTVVPVLTTAVQRPLPPARALVVEDHPTNLQLLVQRLRELGLQVHACDDGQQAWEAWQAQPFDLVITDCHMPHMDGFALARAIRGDTCAIRAQVPIVALTASVLERTREACRDAGIDHFLAKPVAPRRIDVSIRVAKGDLSANMLAFKLDGEVYRPGETVAGTLTIRPFRKPRKTLPVRFKLPDDLPEGAYTLTVCDATSAVSLLRSEMPHKFFARTTQELFDAIQRVVEPPASQLYLRLPLPDGGGLALAQRELPDLPQSKATILSQAGMLDTRSFSRSIVRTLKTDRLITGSASARFRVEREPAETRLRK